MGKERKLSKGLKAIEQFVFQSISLKQERLRRSKSTSRTNQDNIEGMSFDFLRAYMENDGEWTAGIEVSEKLLRDNYQSLGCRERH